MMSKSFLTMMLARIRRKRHEVNVVDRVLDLLRQGASGEAYAALKEALEKVPELSEVSLTHIIRADLELQVNEDICEARRALDRAEEIGCLEIPEYHRVQGDIKLRMGDIKGAVDAYDRSVALEPAPDNLVMLAQALSLAQDKRAADAWVRVLKENPQYCLAHIWLAWEAVRAGDRDKALSMARRSEQLNPSATEVFDVGRIYQTLGEFPAAISAYLRADELGYDENRGYPYAAVASCYLDLGQRGKARQYAGRAMECAPEDDYVKGVWQMCQKT